MCLQKSNSRDRSLTWAYSEVHRFFQIWSGFVWISDGGWPFGTGSGLGRDFFVLETWVLGSGFLMEFWLMICLARSTCLNILGEEFWFVIIF